MNIEFEVFVENENNLCFGLKSKILDFTKLEDIEIFLDKIKNHHYFIVKSIRNIKKNKDDSYEIGRLLLSEGGKIK